jgi:hypothetical protein
MNEGRHHRPAWQSWLVVSALIFRELKSEDGDTVSLHKVLPPVG